MTPPVAKPGPEGSPDPAPVAPEAPGGTAASAARARPVRATPGAAARARGSATRVPTTGTSRASTSEDSAGLPLGSAAPEGHTTRSDAPAPKPLPRRASPTRAAATAAQATASPARARQAAAAQTTAAAFASPASEPAATKPAAPRPPSSQPAAGAATAPVRAERSRPPWSYVFGALALAALSLALAVGALATGTTVGGGGDADRKAALEAARQRTQALTSYDFRRLDQDFAGVLATSTGPFKEEYTKATAQLGQGFAAAEAVATAQVLAAGLESFEGDRAVAVVAVDQQITAKGAQPRTERNRLRMTLVRSEGAWLVEKVERL